MIEKLVQKDFIEINKHLYTLKHEPEDFIDHKAHQISYQLHDLNYFIDLFYQLNRLPAIHMGMNDLHNHNYLKNALYLLFEEMARKMEAVHLTFTNN